MYGTVVGTRVLSERTRTRQNSSTVRLRDSRGGTKQSQTLCSPASLERPQKFGDNDDHSVSYGFALDWQLFEVHGWLIHVFGYIESVAGNNSDIPFPYHVFFYYY